MSVASVEVVAGAKVKNQNEARSTQVGCFQRLFFFHKQELTVPQPVSVTDTESTTLDIGGFSDNSQSLPGMAEAGGKKVSTEQTTHSLVSPESRLTRRFRSKGQAQEGEEEAQAQAQAQTPPRQKGQGPHQRQGQGQRARIGGVELR